MKAVTTFVLLALACPAMAFGIPKNGDMPISKVWHRKFVAGSTGLQTRVPRHSMFARPIARSGSAKIDLNSCSLEDIQNLPGMAPGTAAHILAGRPYRSINDLSRDGVPLSIVDQIRGYVSFGP